MKVNSYKLNIVNVNDDTKYISVLAINKKVALDFCKNFKGLKILEKLKGKFEIHRFEDSESLMIAQKELLEKYLQKQEVIIKDSPNE